MSYNLPKILSFSDWDEWISVKNDLYSREEFRMKRGCKIVSMWRSKGKIPLSADLTAQLVEVILRDDNYTLSDIEIRLMYSSVIIRAVNLLVEPNQNSYYAESVLNIAEKIGLPGWVVELRHDATHNQIPSLSVFRMASTHLLNWLFEKYWEPQLNYLKILSSKCFPIEVSNNLENQAENNFDDYLKDSNPTFLVNIFLPIFFENCLVNKSEFGDDIINLDEVINFELEKQQKFWKDRIFKVIYNQPNIIHSFLCKGLKYLLLAIQSFKIGQLNEKQFLYSIETINLWIETSISFLSSEYGKIISENDPIRPRNLGNKKLQIIKTFSNLIINSKFSELIIESIKSELDSSFTFFTKIILIIEVVNAFYQSGTTHAQISDQIEHESKIQISIDRIQKLDNYFPWPVGFGIGEYTTKQLFLIEEVVEN